TDVQRALPSGHCWNGGLRRRSGSILRVAVKRSEHHLSMDTPRFVGTPASSAANNPLCVGMNYPRTNGSGVRSVKNLRTNFGTCQYVVRPRGKWATSPAFKVCVA